MWPAKLLKDYTVGTKSVEHREGEYKRNKKKKKEQKKKKKKKTFTKNIHNQIAPWENVFGLR